MHCRLDGLAAYDVLENFEQRWRNTTRLHLKGVLPFGKKAHWKEDALRKLERITWILNPAAKFDADAAAAGGDDDGDLLNDLSDVRVFFFGSIQYFVVDSFE